MFPTLICMGFAVLNAGLFWVRGSFDAGGIFNLSAAVFCAACAGYCYAKWEQW